MKVSNVSDHFACCYAILGDGEWPHFRMQQPLNLLHQDKPISEVNLTARADGSPSEEASTCSAVNGQWAMLLQADNGKLFSLWAWERRTSVRWARNWDTKQTLSFDIIFCRYCGIWRVHQVHWHCHLRRPIAWWQLPVESPHLHDLTHEHSSRELCILPWHAHLSSAGRKKSGMICSALCRWTRAYSSKPVKSSNWENAKTVWPYLWPDLFFERHLDLWATTLDYIFKTLNTEV